MRDIFKQQLSQLTAECSDWSAAEVYSLLQTPPDSSWGDYALPCFTLAPKLKMPPPRIAQQIADKLKLAIDGNQYVSQVEVRGAYINFHINIATMSRMVIPEILNGNYFRANQGRHQESIMVEFSQPNTHKSFHVGHMRNVALGDSLVRILRYNGYKVLAANYIGDIGTHVAKCLWQCLKSKLPTSDHGDWLGKTYTEAEQALKQGGAAAKQEIDALLQSLEGGNQELQELWQQTRQWSLDDFEQIYAWLGVKFDVVYFESEMVAEGLKMVKEGLEQDIFYLSEGAVGINLPEEGFFMLLKSDGSTLYSTKDLALARRKAKEYNLEHSIYVVGMEQSLYFKQLFKTLQTMGVAVRCSHLSYGLVMLKDGKMSSRAGNVIAFKQLRQNLHDYVIQNYLNDRDWPAAEIEETARRIAVAAIRYGMLKQDSDRAIIFEMDEWLVSEGDTGSYLCYAYARVESILRRINFELDEEQIDHQLLDQPAERQMIKRLYEFNHVIEQAGEKLKVNLVANFIYQLAREFSRVYNSSSVLNAPNPQLAQSRLALFQAFSKVLRQGMELLGMEPPQRM